MDCTKAVDFLTPAVDGELAEGDRNELFSHLGNCPHCRSAYELEQMTKNAVRRSIPRVAAPSHLVEQVRSTIRTSTLPARNANSWRPGTFFQPFWKPVAAAAILASAVFLFLSTPTRTHHSHASPDDRDVFHQVFNNFDGILDGVLKPDVASDNPEVVQAFFFPKLGFTPAVKKLDDCKLIGGMFSTYSNQNLAHVVYEHHGEIVYIFQANLRCVMDGHTLKLPDDVHSAIQASGHYEREYNSDCSIAAWTKDSIFFCAVADIPKDNLLSCVSSIRE